MKQLIKPLVIYIFSDDKRVCKNICLVSYGFDDKVKPHSIVARPHGNSKGYEVYVSTMKKS